MRRLGWRWCMLALLCAATAVAQTSAAHPVLTGAEQQRAGRLYDKFVAPCCWRQSVAVHQSPEARQVRSEIDHAIEAGRSDSEIKDALIREYGHGILMEPEGWRAFGAYSAPLLALLIGLWSVVRWIRRHVSHEDQVDSGERPTVTA